MPTIRLHGITAWNAGIFVVHSMRTLNLFVRYLQFKREMLFAAYYSGIVDVRTCSCLEYSDFMLLLYCFKIFIDLYLLFVMGMKLGVSF